MRYLLDTTLVIDHAKGRPGAVTLVRELFSEPNDLYICDATVVEATSGVDEPEVERSSCLSSAIEYVSTTRRRRSGRGPRAADCGDEPTTTR